jgi:hypothetical protein
MGDRQRALEMIWSYLSQVGEPLNQVNEMLIDDDLVAIRDELRELRQQYKQNDKPGFFGFGGVTNPIKAAAESIGVEWKD